MKKCNCSLVYIGFLQALGVVIYCGLVAGLLNLFSKTFSEPVGFFGSVFMLVLVVFSAAITGYIVFGYPTIIVLREKKVKEALFVLGYTLIFCLLFLIIAILIIGL